MLQLWILKKLNDFFSYSLIFTIIDNGFEIQTFFPTWIPIRLQNIVSSFGPKSREKNKKISSFRRIVKKKKITIKCLVHQ